MAGRLNGVTCLCEFNGAPVVFFKLIMSEKLTQFSGFEGQVCLKFIAGLQNSFSLSTDRKGTLNSLLTQKSIKS